jgi:hypothetical protein
MQMTGLPRHDPCGRSPHRTLCAVKFAPMGASPPLRQGSSAIVLLNASWYEHREMLYGDIFA